MNEYDELKEKIMEFVSTSKNQRVLPIDATQMLTRKLDLSAFVISEAIIDLVEEEELVYSYRDPSSYLEFPCNGCDGGHRAARPMKTVTDSDGNRWLCDADVDPKSHLPSQGCWECGSMNFTRAD